MPLMLYSCLVLAQGDNNIKEEVSGLNTLREEGFFYTNPLLDCERTSYYLPPFKAQLISYIDASLREKKAKRVSVYFRQLNSGYSFGINESWKYSPASLVKVSTMIQVLKLVEKRPSLLGEKIKYQPNDNAPLVRFDMPTRLKAGNEYSVAELLLEMIVRSDNKPTPLIEQKLNLPKLWTNTFQDLGIKIICNASSKNIISAKNYSTLFRILYNASYLNRKMSGIGLDLLSRTSFRKGIIAGLEDSTIVVANKYGSNIFEDGVQLHESAIVYLASNPYLLSIMTEGKQTKYLNQIIEDISTIVYKNSLASSNYVIPEALEHSNNNQDRLLNPLLDCVDELTELEPFCADIKQFVEGQTDKNEIEQVSVYFRHLVNGRWFSINRNETFLPASLMKIPVMLSVLKASEGDTRILSQEIKTGRDFSESFIKKMRTDLEPDKSYTVLQLVRKMIVRSDNYAAQLLSENVQNFDIIWLSLFDDLGISKWQVLTQPKQGEVSVDQISLLFRVLYNASYLDRENSENALDILSFTRFENGIKKGVEKKEICATKYGERTVITDGVGENQLHDCGIVYYENNPYLLCIMTKGNDMDEQAKTIEDISKRVYQEMKRQFPSDPNN